MVSSLCHGIAAGVFASRSAFNFAKAKELLLLLVSSISSLVLSAFKLWQARKATYSLVYIDKLIKIKVYFLPCSSLTPLFSQSYQ
mmetsp:Transcript_14971/g.43590  ORF Transcript_14971/g.43590 Transcript_14971/m.43590 type:complete len:85 (-) Transcript_14971:67-321(-)